MGSLSDPSLPSVEGQIGLEQSHRHTRSIGPNRTGIPVEILLVADRGCHHPLSLLLDAPELGVALLRILDPEDIIERLKKEFEPEGLKVYPISGVTGKNLKELTYVKCF